MQVHIGQPVTPPQNPRDKYRVELRAEFGDADRHETHNWNGTKAEVEQLLLRLEDYDHVVHCNCPEVYSDVWFKTTFQSSDFWPKQPECDTFAYIDDWKVFYFDENGVQYHCTVEK